MNRARKMGWKKSARINQTPLTNSGFPNAHPDIAIFDQPIHSIKQEFTCPITDIAIFCHQSPYKKPPKSVHFSKSFFSPFSLRAQRPSINLYPISHYRIGFCFRVLFYTSPKLDTISPCRRWHTRGNLLSSPQFFILQKLQARLIVEYCRKVFRRCRSQILDFLAILAPNSLSYTLFVRVEYDTWH